jgi:hypothetical protein
MPAERVAGDPLIDRLASGASRAMAARLPRRSFLGKVGRFSMAAFAGGAASVLLGQESALAGACGCCCADSVSCHCLTGHNECPSSTCECGCWNACDNYRCSFPNSTHWCDCCNTSSGHSARCVSRCSNRPSNCNPIAHTNNARCNPGYTIRCRKYTCIRPPSCS